MIVELIFEGYNFWVENNFAGNKIYAEILPEGNIYVEMTGGVPGPQGEKGDTGDTGPAGTTDWSGITNKPSTFAPSSHNHVISDVTGLQAALDGKQDAGSAASWGGITGTLSNQTDLQSALNGKANSAHNHPISDVTGLQAALDGKQVAGNYAAASHSHSISDVTNLQSELDGKAASSHTHDIDDVTGLQTALDGKQAAGSYATASHVHNIADVTGLQAALDGKQAAGSYAAATHGHTIGDVTGLQATLDGKAATSHNHVAADITDFNSAADARIALQQDWNFIKAVKALGSTVDAETAGFPLVTCNTSSSLTDNQIRWVAVYLCEAATITGIGVYMRTAGSYTGDNTNGAALYTYSAGTLTQVKVSANTSTLWTATANAGLAIPFTGGTYAAQPGLYFVALLYNQSAQTTAPALASGTALNNAAMAGTAWGFTNSAKLYGTSSGNTFPASIAMSSITPSTAPTWVALY